MVEVAHAVANPGAVVVHPQNALFADGAVVGPGGFNVVAFVAILERGEVS